MKRMIRFGQRSDSLFVSLNSVLVANNQNLTLKVVQAGGTCLGQVQQAHTQAMNNAQNTLSQATPSVYLLDWAGVFSLTQLSKVGTGSLGQFFGGVVIRCLEPIPTSLGDRGRRGVAPEQRYFFQNGQSDCCAAESFRYTEAVSPCSRYPARLPQGSRPHDPRASKYSSLIPEASQLNVITENPP